MADIIVDTYTDATGVGLVRHQAETGGGWFSHWRGRQTSQPEPLINANRARFSGFTGTWNGLYYYEDEISGGDYEVESNLVVRSNIGIVGRMELTEPHGYALRVTASQVALIRFANGNPSIAGTILASAGHGLSNGTAHKFKLSFSGSTIKAFVNDVEVLSVVDATYGAGGYVGITWSSTSTSECLWHDFKVISDTASLVARHAGVFSDNYGVATDTNLEDYGGGNYIKTKDGTSAYIEADDDRLYFDEDSLFLVNKHIDSPNQIIEFDCALHTPGEGGSSLEVWFKAGPDYILPLVGTSTAFPHGYRLRLFRGGPTSGILGITLFNIQGSDSHLIANTSIALASGAERHVVLGFQDGLLTVEIGGSLIVNVDTSMDYRCRLGSSGYVLLSGDISGTGAYAWLDNLSITPENPTPPVPCSPEDPSSRPVFDEFNGSNNSSLNSHIADSGHSWITGHGIPSLSGGFLSSPPAPLVLNGNGSLVNPNGMKIEGTHQLVYAPRTRNYEIGLCFTKLSGSFPSSSLYIFWRDTSTEYGPRRGSRVPGSGRGKRYELYIDSGGSLRLIKNISGEATLLDSGSAIWADDTSNYVQILHVGSSIEIYVNGALELTATDAAITENGTVSLQMYGRALTAPFPKGLWTVHWFYLDDSYATVGSPNKALSFTERLTGRETLLRENLDLDSSFFKQIPDGASVIENVEVQKVEATTKSIELIETPHLADLLNVTTDSNCWYHPDWGYRKKLTIDNTRVSGSSVLTDFIIPLVLTDSDVQAQAQVDGDDILFTAADGTTKLDHELVSYNSATGKVEAWIKIPSLSDTVDTDIWMYFGNAGAAAQEDPASLWTGYHAVFHFEQDPSGSAPQVLDSSGNANHGTTEGSMTAGDLVDTDIGKGYDLDGVNDAISYPSRSPTAGNLTVSVLVRYKNNAFPSSGGPGEYTMLSQADGAGTGRTWLALQQDLTPSPDVWNILSFIGGANTGGAGGPGRDFNFNDEEVWFKFTLILDGTTVRVYYNGILDASSTQTPENATGVNYIGRHKTGAFYCFMEISEFKFYNGVRSTDWLRTEYNFEIDPDGYYTKGDLQTPAACFNENKNIQDSLFASDVPEVLGDKGITLLEMARMNELHGVGGSLINKVLQLSEFLLGVEILLPNQEFNLTDDFSISEAVTRVANLLETIQATEIQDIRVALELIDTTNINDVVALYMFHAITDGASLSETIRAIMGLSETFTAGDVVAVLNLMHKSDGAAFGENLSVSKSGPVDIPGDPDAVFQVRLSVYFIL